MKTIDEIVKERAKKAVEDAIEINAKGKYQYPLHPEQWHIDEITRHIQSDIPSMYANAEILDELFISKFITNYKDGKGLYLYGTAGTGKTYKMHGLSKYLRAFGFNTIFWNATNILSRFKVMYEREDEGEELVAQHLRENRALFLDDLGAEKSTEWSNDILYRLINYRYENKLPTYIATNLNLSALLLRYGDRIASRIAEMCEIIEVGGEDRRLKSTGK